MRNSSVGLVVADNIWGMYCLLDAKARARVRTSRRSDYRVAIPPLREYIFKAYVTPVPYTSPQLIMIKLVALYRKPSDTAEFDQHYDNIHTPLVKKYPGLRKLEITRITGAPIGETKFHLMAEMYFDTKESMDAALASPEGKAVAKDLMSFAADIVTVFHGEVKD